MIQKRRKQNMLTAEEDPLIISDCGLSLTQSIDAPLRQRQPQGDGQLPLITQSMTGQALQGGINRKKKPPIDDKHGSTLIRSKNGSTQQLK